MTRLLKTFTIAAMGLAAASTTAAAEKDTDFQRVVVTAGPEMEAAFQSAPRITHAALNRGELPVGSATAIRKAKAHAEQILARVTQANGEERSYRFVGIESIELTEYAGKFVWVADVAYDVVAPAGGKAIRRGNLKTMVLMDGKALPLLKR